MIAKFHAEQIEYFPLMPIGRAPNAVNRINFRIRSAQAAFQTQPLVRINAVQMNAADKEKILSGNAKRLLKI